jgi:hypothetical protein
MVVAVDLMVVLHAALSAKGAKTCADQFWQEPLVPVTSVLDYVNDFYSVLIHVGHVAEIIFVLDGLPPPPKEHTGAFRRLQRSTAEARLREFFAEGAVEDLPEVQALKLARARCGTRATKGRSGGRRN